LPGDVFWEVCDVYGASTDSDADGVPASPHREHGKDRIDQCHSLDDWNPREFLILVPEAFGKFRSLRIELLFRTLFMLMVAVVTIILLLLLPCLFELQSLFDGLRLLHQEAEWRVELLDEDAHLLQDHDVVIDCSCDFFNFRCPFGELVLLVINDEEQSRPSLIVRSSVQVELLVDWEVWLLDIREGYKGIEDSRLTLTYIVDVDDEILFLVFDIKLNAFVVLGVGPKGLSRCLAHHVALIHHNLGLVVWSDALQGLSSLHLNLERSKWTLDHFTMDLFRFSKFLLRGAKSVVTLRNLGFELCFSLKELILGGNIVRNEFLQLNTTVVV